MHRKLSTVAYLLALLIAAISWFALSAQTDITIGRVLGRGLNVMDGVARLTSYLTNLNHPVERHRFFGAGLA